MRSFIVRVLLFILVFIIGYIILVPLWFKFMPYQLGKNIIYFESDVLSLSLSEVDSLKDVDILFLGSSHVYRGVDPMIFGKEKLSVFGLGSSAQSHEQTEVLLKRYLDEISPKMVAYEVFPLMFEISGEKSSSSLLAGLPFDNDLIPFLKKDLNMKKINSFVNGFYSQNFKSFKKVNLKELNQRTYVSRGYKESKEREPYSLKDINNFHWSPKDFQLNAFYRNLTYLKEKNIPVLLYYAPITNNYYESADNSYQFDSLMNSTNLKYINFNNSSDLIDTIHFYDKDHLNYLGVYKFNINLIDSLKSYFPL